jgi:hypothetical protein
MIDGELISDITTVLGKWERKGEATQCVGSVRVTSPSSHAESRSSLPKPTAFSFLVTGPCGSGKTYAMKAAHLALGPQYGISSTWISPSTALQSMSILRQLGGSEDPTKRPDPHVLFLDDVVLSLRILSKLGGLEEFRSGLREWATLNASAHGQGSVSRVVVYSCESRNSIPTWFEDLFPAPLERTLAFPTFPQGHRYLKHKLPVVEGEGALPDANMGVGSSGQVQGLLELVAQSSATGVLHWRGLHALGELLSESHLQTETGTTDESPHFALAKKLVAVSSVSESQGETNVYLRTRKDIGVELPELWGYESLRSRLLLLVRVFLGRNGVEGFNEGALGDSADDVGAAIHVGAVAQALPPTTGILLHGPSGCGKSSFVRELAFRLPNVPFFFVSATRLFSKYLGESEARLRAAFQAARQVQPSVLVIDDIDAISPSRKVSASSGDGAGKGLDVTVRMLSALLIEMDGVDASRGVLVIGTTNRLDSIDKALLRQGRLETLIPVSEPTMEDSTAIVDALWTRLLNVVDGGHSPSMEGDGCLPLKNCVPTGKVERDATRQTLVRLCCGKSPAAIHQLFREMIEFSMQEESGVQQGEQCLTANAVHKIGCRVFSSFVF